MSVFDNKAGTACYRLLTAAASDNATNAVSRPCALRGVTGYNAKASAVYLKLYDKATAPSSSDTPVKTVFLKASDVFSYDFSEGFVFAS